MGEFRTRTHPICQEVLVAEFLRALGIRSTKWSVELDIRFLIGLSKTGAGEYNPRNSCNNNVNCRLCVFKSLSLSELLPRVERDSLRWASPSPLFNPEEYGMEAKTPGSLILDRNSTSF
jgi:hypothetical protein